MESRHPTESTSLTTTNQDTTDRKILIATTAVGICSGLTLGPIAGGALGAQIIDPSMLDSVMNMTCNGVAIGAILSVMLGCSKNIKLSNEQCSFILNVMTAIGTFALMNGFPIGLSIVATKVTGENAAILASTIALGGIVGPAVCGAVGAGVGVISTKIVKGLRSLGLFSRSSNENPESPNQQAENRRDLTYNS
jgi:hypothetical protein